MRFESPTFHSDLSWERKTKRMMLSLVLEPASTNHGYHTSTTCCKCYHYHMGNYHLNPNIRGPLTGPALYIRNLSDENIELAKKVAKKDK